MEPVEPTQYSTQQSTPQTDVVGAPIPAVVSAPASVAAAAPLPILSRADIISRTDTRIELVRVPELGGAVYVRNLTAAERDEYEASMVRRRGPDVTFNHANLRARLVALSACDAGGQRLFSDADVAFLGQKNAAAINRLYEVACRLSGLTKDDLEELAGN